MTWKQISVSARRAFRKAKAHSSPNEILILIYQWKINVFSWNSPSFSRIEVASELFNFMVTTNWFLPSLEKTFLKGEKRKILILDIAHGPVKESFRNVRRGRGTTVILRRFQVICSQKDYENVCLRVYWMITSATRASFGHTAGMQPPAPAAQDAISFPTPG